jgi:penicillin-binding protein 2
MVPPPAGVFRWPAPEQLIPRLTGRLPIRWEEVAPKLQAGAAFRTIPLMTDLTPAQVAYVAERRWEIPGVFLDVEPVRHSPYGELAAHVLGYLGEINEDQLKEAPPHGYRLGDAIGQAGVEKRYERALRGVRGGARWRSTPWGANSSWCRSGTPGRG